MIKSKKTKIQTNKHRNVVTNEKELLVMAHIKNYRCLFCKKNIYIKKFENVKCNNCSSSWFEKLDDKKVKQVEAV